MGLLMPRRRKERQPFPDRPTAVGCSLLAAVMLSLLAYPARALPQAAQATPQQYHIEVTVVLGFGADMTERDFRVLQGGRSIPIRLRKFVSRRDTEKWGFPPHLLVVFRGGKRPHDAALVAILRKPLRSGWVVSVQRTDGRFTEYCENASCLELAVAAQRGPPLSNEAMTQAVQAASEQLNLFAGRRVLISAHVQNFEGRRWLAAEEKMLGLTYLVDGGLVKRESGNGGLADSPGPGIAPIEPGPALPTDVTYEHVDGYDQQCGAHERSLAHAVMNAVRDDRKYYDLEVPLLTSHDGLASGVNLVLLRAGGSPACSALYTAKPGIIDGKPVSLRRPESASLTVSEK